jgi:hypothetical protein
MRLKALSHVGALASRVHRGRPGCTATVSLASAGIGSGLVNRAEFAA